MRHLSSRAARQLTQKTLELKYRTWQGAFRAFGGSSDFRQNINRSSSFFDFNSEASLEYHPQPLGFSNGNHSVSQTAINTTLSSIQHHSSASRLQVSAQNHNNGFAAAVFPGAPAGRAESPPQAGLTTSATNLAGGALSQALHEHLHRGRFGTFPRPLPHALPRPDAQPAAEPCGKPELDLRQHGAPIRDIAVPATGINSLSNARVRSRTGKSFFGGVVEATGLRGGTFSPNGAQMFHISLNQSVHTRGTRDFRSAASSRPLLAEESDSSEVAADRGDSSEVAVSDQASEVVPQGKKKYGPRRSKRIPRSIIGSYDEEFEDELDLAETSPWQDEMYNIRPRVDRFFMKELGANPPLDLEELVAEADDLGLVSEIPDSYAGLPLVLRWETRFVLAPGPSAAHPLNRKVKLQAFLRDLGLSDKGRARMVALVGLRFNRRNDELTLVSQRYSHREENRKDVLRILYALIEESKKADIEGEEVLLVA